MILRSMKKSLRLTPTTGDTSVYLQEKRAEGSLIESWEGIWRKNRNGDFESLSAIMGTDLESKRREWNENNFFGMHLRRKDDEIVQIYQLLYNVRFSILPKDSNFDGFRSAMSSASWVRQTRPGVL